LPSAASRRRAVLPLISASKLSWNGRIWSTVHSFGSVAKASGVEPARQSSSVATSRLSAMLTVSAICSTGEKP
jgi:hypothetical protein